MKKLVTLLFLITLSSSSYSNEVKVIDQSPKEVQVEVIKEAPSPYLKNEFNHHTDFQETSLWKEVINMLITLGCIIALLIGVTWIMKRMQNTRIKYSNESNLIKVVAHRPLSTKTGIYLIHIHDRAIVMADSQNGATCLADFPINLSDENSQTANKFTI